MTSFDQVVTQALRDAFVPAQLGDAVLPAQAIQHKADLVFGQDMPPGSAPDVLHHRFRSSRVPDGDRTWQSAGRTVRLREGLVVRVSYAHVFVTTKAPDRADGTLRF